MTNREKFNQKLLSLTDEELAAMIDGGTETCNSCPAYWFCADKESEDLNGCKEVLVAWFKKETEEDKDGNESI